MTWDFHTIVAAVHRQRAVQEELFIQSVMAQHAPTIARAVAKRQALQFCANWLAKHEFRIVRRQGSNDWMGVSINGKLVAETTFAPLWFNSQN